METESTIRERWRDVSLTIRWRIAAGWVVVMILFLHYAAYPVAAVVSQFYGVELEPPQPLSLADVMAIVGLPVGGAVADRVKSDD